MTRQAESRLTEGVVQLGEIVLEPAGAVSGRVEDPDGVPIPDAGVWACEVDDWRTDPGELRRLGPLRRYDAPTTTTDEHGEFHLGDLPPGLRRVWAGTEGRTWSSADPVEVSAGEDARDLVIVLEELRPDDTIEGIVLSPDGEPVANARLESIYAAASDMSYRSCRSDEEGRFSLLLAHRVPHTFVVKDSQRRWSDVEAPDVAPGAREVVLQFREARWIDVRVRNERGGSIEEFALTARIVKEANHVSAESVEQAVHPGGQADLRAPNYDFAIAVDAPGHALAVLGPYSAEDPPETAEAVLATVPGVRGRVLAGGKPLRGAEVEIHRLMENMHLWVNGFSSFVFGHVPDARATSGEDGAFTLTVRLPGLYVLRATAEGYAPGDLAPFEIDPAVGAEDLEISLGHGGAIAGRVFVGPGENPAGLVVGVNHGDGNPETARTEGDGSFLFEGLTPGMWQVLLREEEIGTGGMAGIAMSPCVGFPEIAWDCEVFEGQTTRFDLYTETAAPTTLVGELAIAGGGARGWLVSVLQVVRGKVERKQVSVAADGSFRIEDIAPGYRELRLLGPDEDHGRLTFEEWLPLEPGEQAWSLRLEPAALTGLAPPSTEGSEVVVELVVHPAGAGEAHPGLEGRCRLVPDASGRFELPLVPAGAVEIRRIDPESASRSSWETVLELTLAPGETRHVILP